MAEGAQPRSRIADLLVAAGIVCLLGLLIVPALLRAPRDARILRCAEHLRRLWTAQENHRVSAGGGAYWRELLRAEPPPFDRSGDYPLACPVREQPAPWGETDYRGPVDPDGDADPLGADRVGNHDPEWEAVQEKYRRLSDVPVNVLLRSGEVRSVRPDDPLWDEATRTTLP